MLDDAAKARYTSRGFGTGWLPPTSEDIARLTDALQAGSKDAKAYLQRGRTYRRRGEWQKAIADLTRAIELDATLLPAYYERRGIRRGGQK